MRVLIVDDQDDARAAVRELLERRGHVVVAETDHGSGALASTAQSDPDLVLVDVRLGAETGFDVARALTSKWPELPVLLMSVDSHTTNDLARASGARGFVLKTRLHTVDLDALART